MITAIVYRTPEGTPRGFHISGHAGFADPGQDVVCAAVSMLAINTANAVETLTEAGFTVNADEKTGDIHLELTSEDEKAALLVEALALGLQTLEKQYENFISLKEEVRVC